MKQIKTLFSLAAIVFAANASADCVVTSDYMKAAAKKEALPNIGCDLDYYIKDMSLRKGVPAYRANLTMFVTFDNQPELEKIDFTGMNPHFSYNLRLENNANLTTLDVADLEVFDQVSFKNSAITDLTFFENVRKSNIYTTNAKIDKTEDKRYSKILKFPKEGSNFCNGIKSGAIKFHQHEINQTNAEKACKI